MTTLQQKIRTIATPKPDNFISGGRGEAYFISASTCC